MDIVLSYWRSFWRAAGSGESVPSNAASAHHLARQGMGYFPAVDGLRALAILAVIVFHLNEQGLKGGLLGVDIFFVISGFVVTASVAHLNFDRFSSFLAHFYARRLRRIYPALCLCLIVTCFLYALFIPNSFFSDAIPEVGRSAFLGLSNMKLAFSGDDYFSPSARVNPFTQTWSLGVEEQFYLLFPILMFAFQRFSKAQRWRSRMIFIISAFCAISLAISAALTPHHFRMAFYTLPSRFWELGVGMLLCLTYDRWAGFLGRPSLISITLPYLSLGAVLISLMLPTDSGFPFPIALLPVLGTAGLISAGVAQSAGPVTRLFSTSPLVFVGKISYSLYLWHWPIFVLARWTTGLQGVYSAIALALTMGLALLSYYFVERPLRYRSSEKPRSNALVVAGSLAAIGIAYFGASVLLAQKDWFDLSQTTDREVWSSASGAFKSDKPGCSVERIPRRLARANVIRFVSHGCGNGARQARIFVAGDSHAGAYERLMKRYAMDSGQDVTIYTLAGCPLPSLAYPMDADCRIAHDAIVTDMLKSLSARDVVFLPSLRIPRFKGGWEEGIDVPGTGEQQRARALEEAKAFLRRIAPAGARVVFEAPTPVFKAPAYRCVDWFNKNNPDCVNGLQTDRSYIDSLRNPILNSMRTLQRDDPKVKIWDPLPYLCTPKVCSSFANGRPLFFDSDHLSGFANDHLYPRFVAMVGRQT